MTGAAPAAGNVPRVTVVVPVWNSARWLPGCLAALGRQTFSDFSVLVVDDGSTDGSVNAIRAQHPAVEVVSFEDNGGFARAVNAGIKRASGEYVALLNVDTLCEPEWLEALVARLDASPAEVAVIASKMLMMEDPGRVDDAGDTFSWYGSARKRGHGEPESRYVECEEVLSACAGAALYRRRLFDAVGAFDEAFESYLEDIDLGLRARLGGFRCLYEPGARVLHQGHGSALERERYVELITCNRLLTLLKNVPLALLLRHCHRIAYGQLYFFLVYRRPLRSLMGYGKFFARLPRVLGERSKIQAARAVTADEAGRLLSTELGEPPLHRVFGEILRSRFAR